MVRELLAVAVRAALQWALATALLANGATFCLIAACAERLRLGAPCVLCARVHRLLCSSAGDGRDALRLLLCDAHLAAATGPDEQQAHGGHAGGSGDGKKSKEGLDGDDRDKVSGPQTHRVVSIGSEICEQEHDANGSDDAGRAGGGTDVDNGPLVSLFELAPIVAHPRDDKATAPDEHPGGVADDGGERLTVGQLLSLRAQRRELDALRAELEAERRARAEAEEYQRQLEEQGELDREAARLAMELVHETEREKRALQQQLDACRARAQLISGEGQLAGGKESDGNNNYQSLVDFLPPGSVYSSSPDLASLLTLCDEPAGSGINGGDRRQREGYVPAVAAVAEEVEEEEEVAVSVTARTECSVHVDGSAAIADDSLHEKNSTSCQQVETVTGAA